MLRHLSTIPLIRATVGVPESTIFINLNSSYCHYNIVVLGSNTGMGFLRVNDLQLAQNGEFNLDLGFCKNSDVWWFAG